MSHYETINLTSVKWRWLFDCFRSMSSEKKCYLGWNKKAYLIRVSLSFITWVVSLFFKKYSSLVLSDCLCTNADWTFVVHSALLFSRKQLIHFSLPENSFTKFPTVMAAITVPSLTPQIWCRNSREKTTVTNTWPTSKNTFVRLKSFPSFSDSALTNASPEFITTFAIRDNVADKPSTAQPNSKMPNRTT